MGCCQFPFAWNCLERDKHHTVPVLAWARVQVESLRQLGDAAGNQLGSTQARLEQLQADKEQQEQQLRAQLSAAQVGFEWHSGMPMRNGLRMDSPTSSVSASSIQQVARLTLMEPLHSTVCHRNQGPLHVCLQVQLLQREAELSETAATADSSSRAWAQEQARLQEAANKWREKALELQEEVRRRTRLQHAGFVYVLGQSRLA